MKKQKLPPSIGFTLIELLVVIAIIAILASAALASFSNAQARARDARRMADMKEIEKALYLYYAEHGTFPDETTADSGSLAGWEVSFLPNFMEYLQPYLPKVPVDPINTVASNIDMFYQPRPADGSFFYNYYFYNWASAGINYGCSWKGSFAVLGFRAVEQMDKTLLPRARCGPQSPPCPRGGIGGVCRDWSNEFDYSMFFVP